MARRAWVVMLAATLLTGCARWWGGSVTPVPTPAIVPTPTRTPRPEAGALGARIATPAPLLAPTPVPPVVTDAGVAYTSPRHGYAVLFPTGWRAMVPSGPQLADALKAADREELAPLSPNSLVEAAGQTLELVAALPAADGAAQAQLTVMALPRDSLSLGNYLEQTVEMLSSAAGTHVERAELDPTLRRDGLPVAVIEYTAGLDHGEPLAGYQATLIAADPATVIVLTFTARVEHYAALRPQFIRIVRSVDPAPHSP